MLTDGRLDKGDPVSEGFVVGCVVLPVADGWFVGAAVPGGLDAVDCAALVDVGLTAVLDPLLPVFAGTLG